MRLAWFVNIFDTGQVAAPAQISPADYASGRQLQPGCGEHRGRRCSALQLSCSHWPGAAGTPAGYGPVAAGAMHGGYLA